MSSLEKLGLPEENPAMYAEMIAAMPSEKGAGVAHRVASARSDGGSLLFA